MVNQLDIEQSRNLGSETVRRAKVPKIMNSTRWTAKALAITAAVGMLAASLPFAASTQAQELGNIKLGVKCVDSNVVAHDSRFKLPPGIQVSIHGEFPKMPASPLARTGEAIGGSPVVAPKEVVWLMVTDAQSGTQNTITNAAVESGSIAANLDRYLSSIRPKRTVSLENLPGDPNYIRPFRTYEVSLGVGSNTSDKTPHIERVLGRGAFSASCIMGPSVELFPDWAIPTFMRITPGPLLGRGLFQRFY